MSIVRYAAMLEAQPEGGFTETFPDIPEAITEGDTREEALFHAADVLTLCLDERIESGDALPAPAKVKGGVWIEPAAAIQAAMAIRTAPFLNKSSPAINPTVQKWHGINKTGTTSMLTCELRSQIDAI
jgi:antitoxin HicB